eukprot:10272277-Ditylum_brightwellii.AAC.1
MDLNAKQLMTIVTYVISLWDRYIWTTGGLIERIKTAYSLMIWTFTPTGKSTITVEEELPINKVVMHRNGYDTT